MAPKKQISKKYDFSRIEKKWQKIWSKKKTHEPDLDNPKNSFYNLMMFPYPSAEGLHAGNMYAFTGADVFGRFKRMQGNDVFEPIGLDGFGIHSENYALKIGTHPLKLSKISEKRYYKQLKSIGNAYAWNEKIETYDPRYYKWTQWLFLQLYKKGLAYKKKALVNWCPKDLTVLADEQVVGGECERCGTLVEKKDLEQWFFKITDYAPRLLENLDSIDWSEKVKIAQKNWIGRSEGALIKFKTVNSPYEVEVFTTRPDTIFGVTFLVLAPEYTEIVQYKSQVKNWNEVQKYINDSKTKTAIARASEGLEKTGVELEGVKLINPATGEEIPIWIADYVTVDYGTGAIMAVPAHDQRDFEFANKYKLPILQVISSGGVDELPYLGDGKFINLKKWQERYGEARNTNVLKEIATMLVGGKWVTKYKLRDWLISRQRYWGPPIPIIYCEKCGIVPVPESDLPVMLPNVKDFRPTGKGVSPLASVKSFVNVKCPNCKSLAKRETDVSDTFLDSAWYFFRYLDGKNKKEIFNKKVAEEWLPVDMYIGGAEHSVLHLLYTRFITMVLKDAGLIKFEEPFKKFRAHGLIIKDGAKMSKSKGNIVNPDAYIDRFGADVLRTYLMFLAPFEQGGDFEDGGIVGVVRFLERAWKFVIRIEEEKSKSEADPVLEKLVHKTIKKVTEDISNLSYNTAISSLMILLNGMEDSEEFTRENIEVFVKLLNPFAPHLAHEIWERLGNESVLDNEVWPKYDPLKIVETHSKIAVQVNGKTRTVLELPIDSSEERVKKEALALSEIKKRLEGVEIKKAIYVKGKILNFVV